jgi:hypothetical protein
MSSGYFLSRTQVIKQWQNLDKNNADKSKEIEAILRAEHKLKPN